MKHWEEGERDGMGGGGGGGVCWGGSPVRVKLPEERVRPRSQQENANANQDKIFLLAWELTSYAQNPRPV